MKISNYSLNYSRQIAQKEIDIFGFLDVCRGLGVEGASLHIRDLESTERDYLARIRQAYLDRGLSISIFTVTTDFGRGDFGEELDKARQAIHAAVFLGAPLLRVFAGSPGNEGDRASAFDRAAGGIRKVCEEAAEAGLTIGLQNHNHNALCRTGDEAVRFLNKVNHPNLRFVLDTGQFAGSRGASGQAPPELKNTDFLESIRKTAPLARYVRAKFYTPGEDESEPFIDYDKVFDILRSVHYQGFVDVVYEPQAAGGEEIRKAMPRIVAFLRSKISPFVISGQPSRQPIVRYSGLTTATYVTTELQTETESAFLEGPAVDRKGNVFFSNIPMEQIFKWDPVGKTLTVFRANSNKANGLLFDRQGRLLACEGSGRVTRTEMSTGKISVLADNYQGKPLGAPNDLTDDERGRIYFTSRLSNRDPKVGNVNAVYRIDPDGAMVRILARPDIDMPNGIVTSPDSRILYLIDADGSENGARRIRAYDLRPDGSVARERLLYDFYPGRSADGMAIDAEGNLYVAAGLHRRRGTSETLDTRPGIHVISPEGKLLAFIETPEDTITNCTFGGPDLRILYITCGKLLLSAGTKIPGKAAYKPEA